jgi:t-SNARE complex subunit (syntaxin)
LKDDEARKLLDSLVEERANVMFQQMLDVRDENTEKIKELHAQVCEDPSPKCEKFFTESIREFIMMKLSDKVEAHQDMKRRVN